ncbi:hypothetical protein HY212_05205 [Candidatus Pacearchaeota archaeon]|nr:hypothetical protein [Candidatus Pacearchaeota archaeon]
MQGRKSGLVNPRAFLIEAVSDRKVTPRITGLSLPIVHIDGAVWYIAVGSSYPARAEARKGVGVHALKGIVSWVKNVKIKANRFCTDRKTIKKAALLASNRMKN